MPCGIILNGYVDLRLLLIVKGHAPNDARSPNINYRVPNTNSFLTPPQNIQIDSIVNRNSENEYVSFPAENAYSLDILSSSQLPYLVRLITCNTSRGLRQPVPQQGVS